jgi:hypothetical protein
MYDQQAGSLCSLQGNDSACRISCYVHEHEHAMYMNMKSECA